jgi:hypothetical protein
VHLTICLSTGWGQNDPNVVTGGSSCRPIASPSRHPLLLVTMMDSKSCSSPHALSGNWEEMTREFSEATRARPDAAGAAAPPPPPHCDTSAATDDAGIDSRHPGPEDKPPRSRCTFYTLRVLHATLFPHTTTHEDSQDDRPLRTDFTDRVCITFFYTLYFFTSFKILNKEKLTYLVYTTVN